MSDEIEQLRAEVARLTNLAYPTIAGKIDTSASWKELAVKYDGLLSASEEKREAMREEIGRLTAIITKNDADIQAMFNECERLTADRERLDWMASNMTNEIYPDGLMDFLWPILTSEKSLRDAIDAARAGGATGCVP